MKVRALVLVPALLLGGCQSREAVAPAPAGSGGAATSGGAGGASDQEGLSGPRCGGPMSLPCAGQQYCAFPESAPCGTRGAMGTCVRRPTECAQHCGGACGCDGEVYCNTCMANAAGVDVAAGLGACSKIRTCDDVVADIAARSAGAACTAVVRLDNETRRIKSARLQCAQPASTSATDARRTAERITGFGAEGQLVSGLAPADEYVFWEPPSERGGVAAVSARSGKVVFGGSIVWSDEGKVTFPVSFNHPATVGPTCGSSAPRPPARGINLVTIDELSAAEVGAALDAVWASALPDGLAKGPGMQDVLVLLYPPKVGPFDPDVAEWVVMVNAGGAS